MCRMLEQVDVIDGVYVYANRDPALTTDFDRIPAWAMGGMACPIARPSTQLNQLTLDRGADFRRGLVGLLVTTSAS